MVTSDYLEATGVERLGKTTLDNVEFMNCGQKNTFNAAIRFDGAIGETSTVTGVVAHSSKGWNFSTVSSKNVAVTNSYFIGSRAIGANIAKSKDITFTGNFVGDVRERDDLIILGMAIDKWACVAVCSYFETDTGCSNVVV